jgi:two-component system chemotaxis response regulator CheB
VIRILLVDDSPLMRRLLDEVFRSAGDFEIAQARSGVEALQQLHAFRPDVITLDIQMPGMDGLACLDRIMLERPCPVIMVSSLTEAGAAATLEALALGAVDFVPKPSRAISLDIDELAPILIEKARAASTARLRRSRRLAERVRARIGDLLAPPRPPAEARPLDGAVRDGTAGAVPGCLLIGASTGGPPALDAVLSRLPVNFAWPVIVAQHMPASFTGPLAQRLNDLCPLDVVEAARPTPLTAGRIFVARGDADLIVSRRPAGLIVQPVPPSPDFHWHPSVDRLVASAMGHFDAKSVVGVLLTGMGNDGAATMTRLRASGGRTIAEAEETAVVWGMPGALVKAGGAEFVEPIDGIADRVIELVGRP